MSVGIWQIVLLLVIVLVIFGAGKLPRMMGDVAKGLKAFKDGMNEEPEVAAPKVKKSPRSKTAKK